MPVITSELVGTWKLLSREDVAADGQRRIDPILGADPVAYLIYDATGHFSAQFMRRDRASLGEEVAGKPPSGANNNSRAVNGYDAYFGTYSVGADDSVTQTLEGALSAADVGKVVTRRFRIAGAELVIELETTASDGQPVTRTLKWQRLA
jgi:hypothetical protein